MSTHSQHNVNAVIQAFNALPRMETISTETGTNHWHFSIRTIDPALNPAYVVFLITPGDKYEHLAAPGKGARVLPLHTDPLKEKIALAVHLLLESFVTGVSKHLSPNRPHFAPWTWSCNDPAIGTAVEDRLREVGVKSELCTVAVGAPGDNWQSDQQWLERMSSSRNDREMVVGFMSR